MQSTKARLSSLLPLALGLIVQGCGAPGQIRPVFPSAIDLAAEAKPVPSLDVLTSDVAAEQYNSSVEAWGERGWSAIARICRWSARLGNPIECPPETPQ
jgi:hypothetical protein